MINTKEIADGKHNRKIVWICDLRYKDYDDKPIRHIKPTRVIIRSNIETTKRIYYSDSHFCKLNSKDNILTSQVIALFDNTGYRCLSGTALNVFDNKGACIRYYKKLCKKAISGLENHKENKVQIIDDKIEDYKSFLNKKF